jgi:F-box interacting protein
MERIKREFVTDGLIQLLKSKNSEVSFLSLNSQQANAIYSDRKLMEFFESKMWISMSKNDDPIKLGELPISLQRTLVGKRFLLVLDGVWNHKKEMDILFKKVSSISCKEGSKVVSITHATEISDLDDSILMTILSKLPIKTIFVSKCVNKEWCTLIEDPIFPKLHLAQATFCPIFRTIEPKIWPSCLHMIEVNNTNDLNQPLKFHSKLLPPTLPFLNGTQLEIPPKFGIVNSCNGLLCVCTCPFNNPMYVWNPITGEYILIPKPERNPNTNNYNMDKELIGESYYTDFVVSGFGFSSKANQYRVMRAFGLVQEGGIYLKVVQVWILGSKKWKTLGRLHHWTDIGLKVTRRQTLLPKEASYRQSFCVYLNSAVHWLAICNSDIVCICSFNFDQEKLIRFSLPESFYENEEDCSIGNMRLGVLGDCLYVSDLRCYANFELWVLKEYKYDDDNLPWTKEIVINNFTLNIWPRGLYRPIKYLENGDLLMFHPSNALVCYNSKEKSFRYFKIGEEDLEFEMIPHIPNLIPMKNIVNMEGSRVEILNVR